MLISTYHPFYQLHQCKISAYLQPPLDVFLSNATPKCQRFFIILAAGQNDKIGRIGAGIFDIYLLLVQATMFCKSRDFSFFQRKILRKGLTIPSVLPLCSADCKADFLTKKDFGIL